MDHDPPESQKTLTMAERLAFEIETRVIRQRVLLVNGTLTVDDALEITLMQAQLALYLRKDSH